MLNKYLYPQHTIRFDKPDDTGGDSSGDGDGDGDSSKKVVIDGEHILPDEILQKFKKTADKHGGMDEFAETLYNENKKLRDKLRDADSKGLKDGQVAVPKEVSEHYQKIKELGGFDEVIEKVEGYDTAVSEKNELQRSITNKNISDIYGYNSDVLQDLTADKEVEIKEVDTDDGKQKQAFIKGEDDSETELSEWIEENKAAYLPALENSDRDGSRTRITRQDSANDKKTSGSAVQRIKDKYKKEAEKDNPLTAN